jgi:hypothetical protein
VVVPQRHSWRAKGYDGRHGATVIAMGPTHDEFGLEADMNKLKVAVDKYLSEAPEAYSEVAADLTRAIHQLSDSIVNLHRRMEKIENDHEEWTTRGWLPPPGSDSPS